MKRVAVLVPGYFPHFSPIGQVFEKIRPIIEMRCEMEFFHLRKNPDEPSTSNYGRSKIHAVSNWLYDMHISNGRLAWLLRPLSRALFAVLCAFRLETKEDSLCSAFCRAVNFRHGIKPFDIVLSFAAPLAMHTAALKFKRRNPQVKWVTYSADTAFDNPVLSTCLPIRFLRPYYVRKRQSLELMLYSRADMNLFTPEIMSTLSVIQGGIVPHNAMVVEYPFFDADAVDADVSEFKDSKALNFVYAGGVDPIIRSPDYMIGVFRHLPEKLNVVCHIYLTGNPSPSIEAAVRECPKRFMLHRPLPYLRMLQVMKAADALINLGNNSNAFSPSKLYDYFSTGLPILSFVYAGKNKSEIFDKYPCFLELENYSNMARDALRLASFCDEMKHRRIDSHTVLDLFPAHTVKSIAAKFLSAMLNNQGDVSDEKA